MVDVRPLPGIRYAPDADLAALVTPPFDVITAEEQARFYARHPENVIRLELGRDEPADDELDNRYTRAAALFAEWRLRGVLRQDAPALYLYEQSFMVGSTKHHRLSVLARVRLEPWDARVILPHERTLSQPKDDRLRLIRACAANLSPILALYDDPQHELAALLAPLRATPPTVSFHDEAGDGHRLWLIASSATTRAAAFFRPRQLYIADGHHRYETALAYREEVHTLRKDALPDDATNYVLMALTAIEDDGLVIQPTHRIIFGLAQAQLAGLPARLEAHFSSAPLGEGDVAAWVQALAEAGADGEHVALVLVRPEGATLLRLRPEGAAALRAVDSPAAEQSEAWRRLDVTVLHELLLRETLGVSDDAVRAGEQVRYTRDAAAAIAAVRAARAGAQLAVLLNATPAAAVRDIARAGERMPQKSTYIYPKLLTGLVFNPLW